MAKKECVVDQGLAPHREERTYLSITSDNLQLVTLSELPVSADRIEVSAGFLSITADKHNIVQASFLLRMYF